MSVLLNRVSHCLRAPPCSSRYTVVYGKQLATWRDRLKRWHSSPKSEKQPTPETASDTASNKSSCDDGADESPLTQLVAEKDEMIAKQKTELEELNVRPCNRLYNCSIKKSDIQLSI